ncbi:Scavenger receptor class B member 1 [Lucilia cuprina]|nr:Scavenger receptor class B member 1 [Lucilia cuprina]
MKTDCSTADVSLTANEVEKIYKINNVEKFDITIRSNTFAVRKYLFKILAIKTNIFFLNSYVFKLFNCVLCKKILNTGFQTKPICLDWITYKLWIISTNSKYLRYGRSARDRIFGWLGVPPPAANDFNRNVATNLTSGSTGSVVVVPSQQTTGHAGTTTSSSSRTHSRSHPFMRSRATPLSMLISQGAKLSNRILLTTIPWLDYFILKNLRLWNDTLSYHYWQRPGVIRLTKVYIYNVTNPDGFLQGEKPKLQEVGPFVYREDMQKVNVKFHDNFTVSYQHKKILEFVPELSIDKNTQIITPNIPLLTSHQSSQNLGYVLSKTISVHTNERKFKPL